MMLRVNWVLLIIYLWKSKNWLTAVLYLLIMVVQAIINLQLWRRLFHLRFNFEVTDKQFSLYCHMYPCTSKLLTHLSFFLTFQAIRLTYSRLLGKKQFMAKFTSQKKLWRLLGRLSLLEVTLLYLPSIAINAINLKRLKNGS
jgi:hypothetical protein